MNPPIKDPNFYKDGSRRMISEGIETVSRIMAYIKQNESKLHTMSVSDRKKEIMRFEPSKLFNQVHPIVFQYIVEGVFNAPAFKRYVTAVYGKEKPKEEMEKARTDRRYMYHYKNAQYALYYKYLLMETNPTVNINRIQQMYSEMVDALNEDTDNMLDSYEKAEIDAKARESEITDEKRKDMIELLRKKYSE